MHHLVRVAPIAYTAAAIALLLVLVATTFTTAHTSAPDPGPVVFQPVTAAAPSAAPRANVVPKTLVEPNLDVSPVARPKVPQAAATLHSALKPKPKPKPAPKPKAKPAPRVVHHTTAAKPKPRPKRTVTRTVARSSGVPSVAYARSYARSRIGSTQFSCLDKLWNRESGWNPHAYNRSSGAYGIPQALPGSKMASAGANWRTSAITQIAWGLGYIRSVYGTPCGAWGHSEGHGWY
jgi:outer membrane biosynthesis protein TonB